MSGLEFELYPLMLLLNAGILSMSPGRCRTFCFRIPNKVVILLLKESNKKVNLIVRPPQHTEVGKGVQTGRLEMALGEEHSPMHQQSSGHWNEAGGGGGGVPRSNNCLIFGVVSMPQYFLSITY